MIKINRDKRAIQIGELVVVKKWSPKQGYVYSDKNDGDAGTLPWRMETISAVPPMKSK